MSQAPAPKHPKTHAYLARRTIARDPDVDDVVGELVDAGIVHPLVLSAATLTAAEAVLERVPVAVKVTL